MKTLITTLITFLCYNAFAGTGNETPAPTNPVPIEVQLTTVSVNDEGEHLLADSKGNTLYVFDLDLNKSTSVCNAACAELWPPYLVTKEEAQTLKPPLSVITRESKKLQLAYEGRPVYAYALDRKVGDDAGNNIGDVWHYIEVEVVKEKFQ